MHRNGVFHDLFSLFSRPFRPASLLASLSLLVAALAGCGGGGSHSGPPVLPTSASLPATCTSVGAGASYNCAITVTGGKAPYSWTVTGLPSGLSYAVSADTTTLTISGAAAAQAIHTALPSSRHVEATSASTSASVQISITDASGRTASLSFTININALGISSTTLPNGTVGAAYSASVSASGGAPPYTWTITGLPTGLTSTGASISGTPTQSGTFTITVRVNDSAAAPVSVQVTLSLTISPAAALAISTSTLSGGTAGAAYAASVTATGGVTPYTWTITGLPSGITATSATPAATISGATDNVGTFTVTAMVADSASPPATASATLSLTIAQAAEIVISPSTLPNGSVSTAYGASITATGGVAPFTFSMDAASSPLPAGLSFAATSTQATISGTPTTAGTTNNIIIDVKDSEQPAVTQKITYSITITSTTALSITTTSPLTGATLGTAYSATVTASGGVTPYTWTVATGSTLPAGLTLASASPSATISGTPTVTGTFQFTLKVTDSTTPTPLSASATFMLTVTGSSTLNCPTTVNLTLCGTYPFGLRGFTSTGAPLAMGGVFVANNSGNIISGVMEINESGATPAAVTITGGSYAMDSSGDGRGVLTLITSSAASSTFRFVLESTTNAGLGQMEEFDDSGVFAVGVVGFPETAPIPQIPANLIVSLGLEGFNGSGQRAAMLGEFQVGSSGCDGSAGSLNSVAGEPLITNTAGTVNTSLTATGSCTAADTNTGVGTVQITISGGTPFTNSTLHFVYVAVGAGTTLEGVLMLETDPVEANQPILSGLLGGVIVPTGGFNATSLGCPCLFAQGGITTGTTTTGHSVASIIRLLTTPGTGASGTLTGVEDSNAGGTITLAAALGPYNYTVDANGVGTISASSTIHFIINSNSISTLDESISVLTGSFRAQNATTIESPGAPYIVGLGDGDLSGVNPSVQSVVGVITPSNATSGTIAGTVDVKSSTSSSVGVTPSGTYTIDSTTGRGTGTVNLTGGTSSLSVVVYTRRIREFIIVDMQSSDPYQAGARLQ
jgi:hypothetical protein